MGKRVRALDDWYNGFKGADSNGDGWLSREGYATTKPKEARKPVCKR